MLVFLITYADHMTWCVLYDHRKRATIMSTIYQVSPNVTTHVLSDYK